jgi:hypothetical protein
MNELSQFFQRFGFFFFLLSVTAQAGELNLPLGSGSKPFAKPTRPTNSTFHSEFQQIRYKTTVPLSHDEIRRQQIAKALSARWLQTHLTTRRATPIIQAPQTTTAVTPLANDPTAKPPDNNGDQRTQWKPMLAQATTFLWIQHTFRFLTEPGTRAELKGPFFADWFTSVKNTRGWHDGDEFLVNYIGHPMQGAVTNYIYVQNDPKSRNLEAGFNKAYFKSRMKAMLFSTVYSTQFELGLLGEAGLGNVGRVPTPKSQHPMAYVDLVVTPTLGTMWMVGEDALDRLLVKRLEDHVENRVVRLLVRSFLNPSRSFANALRGRYPWYRDGRRL